MHPSKALPPINRVDLLEAARSNIDSAAATNIPNARFRRNSKTLAAFIPPPNRVRQAQVEMPKRRRSSAQNRIGGNKQFPGVAEALSTQSNGGPHGPQQKNLHISVNKEVKQSSGGESSVQGGKDQKHEDKERKQEASGSLANQSTELEITRSEKKLVVGPVAKIRGKKLSRVSEHELEEPHDYHSIAHFIPTSVAEVEDEDDDDDGGGDDDPELQRSYAIDRVIAEIARRTSQPAEGLKDGVAHDENGIPRTSPRRSQERTRLASVPAITTDKPPLKRSSSLHEVGQQLPGSYSLLREELPVCVDADLALFGLTHSRSLSYPIRKARIRARPMSEFVGFPFTSFSLK
jgi:hypothetical protein